MRLDRRPFPSLPWIVLAILSSFGCRQEVRPVEGLSPAMQGLVARAEAFVELRRRVVGELAVPDPSTDPAEIALRERALIEALRKARPAASRGDVIDSTAAEELRRILREAPRDELAEERADLNDERVAPVDLRVNAVYPEDQPLVMMPASMLRRLPPLPEELQFRAVGETLVLLDRESRLIVDFVPDALPR